MSRRRYRREAYEYSAVDMKLLEFGERSGVEPALHLGIQVAGAATAEGESLDGAMMLGDYLGGGGKGDERGGDGNAGELDADVEVERRGAPQGTPSDRKSVV